jgi:hypothetical protein
LKNQQATLLLAVILAAPAFAVADNIPGHFKGESKYVALSEGFAEQQDLQGNSARCNFLLSSIKENGSKTSSITVASLSEFTKGEKGSNHGALLNTGVESDSRPAKLVDFGTNKGDSLLKDNGKRNGKHDGDDADGNGAGVGSGTPSPLISVPEPGSQSLFLVGLAGLGMVFIRRRTLTNAI